MRVIVPILLVAAVLCITAEARAQQADDAGIHLADPFQIRIDESIASGFEIAQVPEVNELDTAGRANVDAPRESLSTSLRQRQRLGTASPDFGRSLSQEGDILGEFQTIATWSGVVIFLAGAVLVILKSWGIRGPQLAGNTRLTHLATLQLRPDAQLLLVSADGQKFLVTLDRQGLRFVQQVSNWGDMVDESAVDTVGANEQQESSHA